MQDLAQQIIHQVSRKYNVSIEDIVGIVKTKVIVKPRYEAVQRVRGELGLSYPQIGKIFNRDHTSIMSACRKDIGIEMPPKSARAKKGEERQITIAKQLISARRVVANGNGYVVVMGGEKVTVDSRMSTSAYLLEWDNGKSEFISDAAALKSLGLSDGQR